MQNRNVSTETRARPGAPPRKGGRRGIQMLVHHLLSAENALSDISLRRIRISRIRDLNDPFELLAGRSDDKWLRKILSDYAANFNRTNGLLCFSKNWGNPVLWSHYASKHRGMCLTF